MLLEIVLDRKQFLVEGFTAIGSLKFVKNIKTISKPVAVISGIVSGMHLLHTPEALPRKIPDELKGKIYHGSLEDVAMQSGITKFIDPADHGHVPLLKAVVFGDAIVKQVTKKTFMRKHLKLKLKVKNWRPENSMNLLIVNLK